MMVVQRHGVSGRLVVIECLVIVGCERDSRSHGKLDDAIHSRTHPKGNGSGGHGVNGARWWDPR